MSDLIQTVLIYALPVIFAITLHEAAHGYAALRLGASGGAASPSPLHAQTAGHMSPLIGRVPPHMRGSRHSLSRADSTSV